MKDLLTRKNIRLKGYDYGGNGAYFLTICTEDRERLLGEVIVGQGLCSCRLTDIGNLVECETKKLSERFLNVTIDKYVIMPNHVHIIIFLEQSQNERQEQSPCPTIGDIMCAYKSITTKLCNRADNITGRRIWQFRYHDHIIRDEEDYLMKWNYIDTNPARWAEDKYYSQ